MSKPSIFSHESEKYLERLNFPLATENGAFYYSKEIVENIIPRIKTNRNWVTVNVRGQCFNHSIVFIHNNKHPEMYDWLAKYQDLILVCSIRETCEKMRRMFPKFYVIYVPLSVDVRYIKKFKKKQKTKECAFAGRSSKKTTTLPKGIDYLCNMHREHMLERMSEYKTIYAVGRTAIEAKILGCEIGIYDYRYHKDIWEIHDNKDIALYLQAKLDIIDEKE